MRKFLSILPALLLMAACSGDVPVHTFKVPEIDHFAMTPDGEILFYGKQINEFKALNLNYDFSVASNQFLKNARVVFVGKAPSVKNDTTLAIAPGSIERIELTRGDSMSAEINGILKTTDPTGKAAKLTITDKQVIQNILRLIASGQSDYTLWLTLEDRTKEFWDPAEKVESFYKVGFYMLWMKQKGDYSNDAKIPVLEWREHVVEK